MNCLRTGRHDRRRSFSKPPRRSIRASPSPHLRRLGIKLLEDRRLLDGAVDQQVIELFDVSPALFVGNQAQGEDESVRYTFHGSGANVLTTDKGAVFRVFQREAVEQVGGLPEPSDPFDPMAEPEEIVARVAEFSVRFEGAGHVEPACRARWLLRFQIVSPELQGM